MLEYVIVISISVIALIFLPKLIVHLKIHISFCSPNKLYVGNMILLKVQIGFPYEFVS